MERKPVYFNTKEGPDGRRTTSNGGIEIVKYGTGLTDLYIRGPKGGLRHVVIMSDHDALTLGQELLGEAFPEFLGAYEAILKGEGPDDEILNQLATAMAKIKGERHESV